jgi:hypothetical protein
MPIFDISRYHLMIERGYARHDEEMNGPVIAWLNEQPKARAALEKVINGALKDAGERAIKDAFKDNSPVIKHTINLQKLAQRFWGKMAKPLQQQLHPMMVLRGLILILEDAGFTVKNYMVEFEHEIEFEEAPDMEEPAPENENDGYPDEEPSSSSLLEEDEEPAPEPTPEPAPSEPPAAEA